MVPVLGILLAVSASVSPAEFFELKSLSANDVRTRFGLPPSCEPAITAVASDPAANRVTVAIDCIPQTGEPPASTAPRAPSRPAAPRK